MGHEILSMTLTIGAVAAVQRHNGSALRLFPSSGKHEKVHTFLPKIEGLMQPPGRGVRNPGAG